MNPKELFKLLTKYHLVSETDYGGELYVFHQMDAVHIGYIVAYGYSGMPMVSFAKGVQFTVNKGVPCIICYGLDNVPEDQYENKLKTLEKQYHQAEQDYKNYLIKEKLKKMNKDFK